MVIVIGWIRFRRHMVTLSTDHGLELVVLLAATVFLGYAVANTGRATVSGMTLRAKFDRIDGLAVGADVRLAGVKVGTVTADVATAVKNAKAGQVQFRVDKAGIVHGAIGLRSFDVEKLQGNLAALIDALVKAKPQTSKGVYLRKVAVSSTMGVGVRVDTQSIAA